MGRNAVLDGDLARPWGSGSYQDVATAPFWAAEEAEFKSWPPHTEKVLVLTDMQIPYQDDRAMQSIVHFAADYKPDIIVLLGDIWDFPYLSTKFLRRNASPQQLMTDISVGRLYFNQLHQAAPDARVIFVEGNHEARLRNYVLECAPALEGLVERGEALSLQTLVGLDYVEWHEPYGEAFIHRSFVFKHGDIATRYAAVRELEMEGSSGMSGHTHRYQVATKTDRGGAHSWTSLPCLCYTKGDKIPPGVYEGSQRVLNWQQGFGLVQFSGGQFATDVRVITEGRFIGPDGRVYGPQGVK